MKWINRTECTRLASLILVFKWIVSSTFSRRNWLFNWTSGQERCNWPTLNRWDEFSRNDCDNSTLVNSWRIKQNEGATDALHQLFSTRFNGHNDVVRICFCHRTASNGKVPSQHSNCMHFSFKGAYLHNRFAVPKIAFTQSAICRQTDNWIQWQHDWALLLHTFPLNIQFTFFCENTRSQRLHRAWNKPNANYRVTGSRVMCGRCNDVLCLLCVHWIDANILIKL